MDNQHIAIVAVPPQANKVYKSITRVLNILFIVVRDLSMYVGVTYLFYRLHLYYLMPLTFVVVGLNFLFLYLAARDERATLTSYQKKLAQARETGDLPADVPIVVVDTTTGQVVHRVTPEEFKVMMSGNQKPENKVSELSEEDNRRAEALRNAASI